MREKFTGAIFDIDGTLKKSGEKVLPEMRRTIGMLPIATFNTARSLPQLKAVIPPELIKSPVAVLGGAEIWSPEEKVLHSNPLSSSQKELLSHFIFRNQSQIAYFSYFKEAKPEAVFFFQNGSKDLSSYQKYYRINVHLASSSEDFMSSFWRDPISMLVVKFTDGGVLDWQNLSHEIRIEAKSETTFCLANGQSDKGTATLEIARYLKTDPSRLVSAGDTEGVDTLMFQHSHGIAVGKPMSHAKEIVSGPQELSDRLQAIFS